MRIAPQLLWILAASFLACGGPGSAPDAGPDGQDGSADGFDGWDGGGDGSDSPTSCEPGFFGPDCRPCDCLGAAVCDDGIEGTGACRCAGAYAWTAHPDNPVIAWQDFLPNVFWNDPSVLREDDGYRMWLSGGDPSQDPIRVSVYHASSADGVSWQLTPGPVLSPGEAGAWDSERIETPDVVRVGDTYHLYYSGCGAGCGSDPVFAIGHATSPDGLTWTKDPNNPILTHQAEDQHAWGAVGANEPATVHDPVSGIFSLYYAGIRFDGIDPTIGRIGILLATSSDGSQFSHVTDDSGDRRLILTRDIPGATSGSWFGYANPGALRTADGQIHLFCGFVVAPGGPATARTVTIDHAVSDDGLDFSLAAEALIEAGLGDWKDQNVRAASAIDERGGLKLWFAGDTQTPAFGEGIGLATANCE